MGTPRHGPPEMRDLDLHDLRSAVDRSPEDVEAWIRLARATARTPRSGLPVGFGDLDRLQRLWAAHPRERALGALVLPLLGLQAPQASQDLPPRPWRDVAEIAQADGHWYDLATGLPLVVQRVRDQAPMTGLGPGTAIFVDNHPITRQRFRRFCDATEHPDPPGLRDLSVHPHLPVTSVSFPAADAYAAWVRGFLPDLTLFEEARRRSLGDRAAAPPLHDHEEVQRQLAAVPIQGPAPLRPAPDPDDPAHLDLRLDGPLWEWTRSMPPAQDVPLLPEASIRAPGHPNPSEAAIRCAVLTQAAPPGQPQLDGHARWRAAVPTLALAGLGFRVFLRLDPLGTRRLRLGPGG